MGFRHITNVAHLWHVGDLVIYKGYGKDKEIAGRISKFSHGTNVRVNHYNLQTGNIENFGYSIDDDDLINMSLIAREHGKNI